MMLPLDIHNKEFKRTFRGYNENDVDAFLDKVIRDYEQLYRENVDLKETVDRLNNKLDHFQHIESTLHNTLLIAQETAEEVKINTKKETELLLRESEIRSKVMLDEAMARVRKMTSEYEEIQKQAQIFRTRFRTMLQAQLDMLKSAEDDAE